VPCPELVRLEKADDNVGLGGNDDCVWHGEVLQAQRKRGAGKKVSLKIAGTVSGFGVNEERRPTSKAWRRVGRIPSPRSSVS
jgi:hypothetical protein